MQKPGIELLFEIGHASRKSSRVHPKKIGSCCKATGLDNFQEHTHGLDFVHCFNP